MIGPKILIDTNILFGLEDNKAIDSKFSELQQKSQKYGIQLYVHEASKQDIARDRDPNRQNITLSKLDKFLQLEGIPIPDVEYLENKYGRIRKNKGNDLVDVTLLHSLYEVGAVDFLISQDIGCLLYTSPSPRDQRGSRMPSSA